MAEKYTFKVNGCERTVEVDADTVLIDVLREDLQLTGTKRGCDNYTCGACTVILNGKAVKSCRTTMDKVQGGEVITVEGVSNGKELHPVQKALVDSGAIQCGFCTPGIVTELVALFDNNPDADEDTILKALNKHLCRCTGYEAIKDGAMLAKQLIKGSRLEP
jgi:aerobic-type carbon monoxide dehydrogenase small subunit (CoxS/CutS family)